MPEVLQVGRGGQHQDVGTERHDRPAVLGEQGLGAIAEGVAHRRQDGGVEAEGREEHNRVTPRPARGGRRRTAA